MLFYDWRVAQPHTTRIHSQTNGEWHTKMAWPLNGRIFFGQQWILFTRLWQIPFCVKSIRIWRQPITLPKNMNMPRNQVGFSDDPANVLQTNKHDFISISTRLENILSKRRRERKNGKSRCDLYPHRMRWISNLLLVIFLSFPCGRWFTNKWRWNDDGALN